MCDVMFVCDVVFVCDMCDGCVCFGEFQPEVNAGIIPFFVLKNCLSGGRYETCLAGSPLSLV